MIMMMRIIQMMSGIVIGVILKDKVLQFFDNGSPLKEGDFLFYGCFGGYIEL